MAELFTTCGRLIRVDYADLPAVAHLRWRAVCKKGSTLYAVTGRGGKNSMHRLLLGVEGEIDHINGDGLDNRRENLRPATKAQNQHNKSKHKTNTSGYKGVSWMKTESCWQANIKINGKQKKLGRFDTPESAHEAYCKAARELHGEFARTG